MYIFEVQIYIFFYKIWCLWYIVKRCCDEMSFTLLQIQTFYDSDKKNNHLFLEVFWRHIVLLMENIEAVV